MDQLELWAVRGRVATAVTRVREALARLAVDSKELTDAMAEAEQFGLCDVMPTPTGSNAMWGPAR